MSPKDINYSALGKKSLLYRLTHFNLKDPLILVVFAVLMILLVAVAVYAIFIDRDYMIALPMLILYVGGTAVFAEQQNYHTSTNQSIKQFARENDWYAQEFSGKSPCIPPSVMNRYTRVKYIDNKLVTVNLADISFELAYIYAKTDRGAVKDVLTVARYMLPGSVDRIILDNRKLIAYFSSFDRALVETSLEGNFSQDFRLLHMPNDQINALSVITPDVMYAIQASRTDFEIEIKDNYLYLFSFFDHSDEKSTKDLFQTLIKIAPEIAHQVRTA